MFLRPLSGLKEGSIDEALPSRLAEVSRGSGVLEDVLLVLPESSSKLRSSSDGTWTLGRYGLRSYPVLVVCRCRRRSICGVGGGRSEGVDGSADSASLGLLDMRRWRRLGIELSEERALVMREGRRCRPLAGLASSGSRGVASMCSGFRRCESGRDA